MGRSRSVVIATRYGLDGPGIETRCGPYFPHPPRPALGTHPASYTVGTGSFQGVKRPGRGVDHTPPSSAEVKERVEPYISSPLGLRGLLKGELNLTFEERLALPERLPGAHEGYAHTSLKTTVQI